LSAKIPYGRQDITETDIDAVVDVLRSDFLTQGPMVPRFEQAVADYCGAQHAVATNSATSALHTACLALGLGPGDWLWTSPITFVASANCALYCGAQVDFVDIDPRTYNLSVERLAEKLSAAEKDGKLPKIVVPIHLCGQPCDMASIQALSRKYGFKIVEDAAHAIGGRYKAHPSRVNRNATRQSGVLEPIGNCRYSDIAVFSFHPVKIITTGEGGMALTNNAELADLMQRYRSHGITSNRAQMQARPADEIWNYQQIRLGYNYRMTDIQAALGLSQMARVDDYVSRRHRIAERYDNALRSLPLQTPWQHPDGYSSYHLYPVRIRQSRCGKTQRQVYDDLTRAGIAVNLHYIPVYRQPYYEDMGFRVGYCPEAEQYHKEMISIPMFAALTAEQQDYVIQMLTEVLST
jgi:UDP-4-amino-4,6-dideoxy-N-acetyl-beta-L-altrosamine transaminase